MGQAPFGNTAFGSRSTIPLRTSTNLPSLPRAPVEGFPIPTWSFQESYEAMVSTQGGYYADPYTAPPVASYPSVTYRTTSQGTGSGANPHGSAYDSDPGVTYRVTGQSVAVVTPTPAPQLPAISQPPPANASAADDNDLEHSHPGESQPAPGRHRGGINLRNIQSWAERVALEASGASWDDPGYEASPPPSDRTPTPTPRTIRAIETTLTPGANTCANTQPARVPSPDEITAATPRPLRVMNVTPGNTATPLANAQPAQGPQPPTPAFDVDAMVARAYDETAQASQETEYQTTTCITELAVVVTERRLIVSSHV